MPRKNGHVGFRDEGAGGTATLDPGEQENGAEHEEPTSRPGEQGIATQPEDEKKEATRDVWERSASQQEIAFSHDVLQELKDRAQDMGAEAVIDALVRVVDVHPAFQIPAEWPGKTDVVYHEAALLKQIGAFMLRGCARLEMAPTDVLFLWYNKKTWTKNGQQVFCDAAKLGPVASFLAKGKKAVVIANYQLFRLLNTRQRLAQMYKALRKLDPEGSTRAPQFSGWFDEIELFGTGTNEMDVLLRRAMENGSQRELPFAVKVDELTLTTATDPNQKDDDEEEDGED